MHELAFKFGTAICFGPSCDAPRQEPQNPSTRDLRLVSDDVTARLSLLRPELFVNWPTRPFRPSFIRCCK